ncbi:hypothetical protein KBD69_05315 [Candidatus Woesebacteria bacterium]|nr:hypothetical protein [Candidatus Woesebacteria bacterium]
MVRVAVLAGGANEFASSVENGLETAGVRDVKRISQYSEIMEWLEQSGYQGFTHAFIAHKLDGEINIVGQSFGGRVSIILRDRGLFTVGLLDANQPVVSGTMWSVNPSSYMWAIEQIASSKL